MQSAQEEEKMQLMKEISSFWSVNIISREGEIQKLEEELLFEYKMDIYVNGKWAMQCFCTPTDLENFVIGRLFTEGMIEGIYDIQECVIQEEEHCAYIVLKKNEKNYRGNESKIFNWKEEWIFKLADAFAEDTALHKRTSCAHSCFLAQKDKMLYAAEDIGRHNAVDKVIGWAVRKQIKMEESILYTSGRVPLNMVQKAVRTRIPLIVSKAVATKDAVIFAQENRISVIGETKRNCMKVYTDFRKK